MLERATDSTGILAADAVVDALAKGGDQAVMLDAYPKMLQDSWLYQELKQVRNFRPWFKYGMWAGIVLGTADSLIFKGIAPWTISHPHPDHEALVPKEQAKPITYPAPVRQIYNRSVWIRFGFGLDSVWID